MPDLPAPRVVNARNRGPFTLDGTRSFLVGRTQVAVIDPGPDVESHVRALVRSVRGSRQVHILLTHGHGDHAGGARRLAGALEAPVCGPPSAGFAPVAEGDVFSTDAGVLRAVATPGHTRDHLAFHWPAGKAVFVGDLLLGRGATTWLGEYPGCVADYLSSLERIRGLSPTVLYPAHGSPVRNPEEALDRFRTHRMDRLRQVREALQSAPGSGVDEILRAVYGRELPERILKAARASVEVMLHHLASGD